MKPQLNAEQNAVPNRYLAQFLMVPLIFTPNTFVNVRPR